MMGGSHEGRLEPINPTNPFDPAVRSGALRGQLEAFVDERRRVLYDCLDALTEEQARQREVVSNTTLLGLVKHATFVERVWFGMMIAGLSREQLGIPDSSDESFDLAQGDTVDTIRADYLAAWAESRRIAERFGPDDVVADTPLGSLPMRWIYLHLLRELAQHCGHADILRERVLNPTVGARDFDVPGLAHRSSAVATDRAVGALPRPDGRGAASAGGGTQVRPETTLALGRDLRL